MNAQDIQEAVNKVLGEDPIDREDYTSLDLVVYRTYNYRGVNVLVKLDFIESTVSLVERDDNKESGFKPKDWLFADRGLEYLNGWRLILKAMDYAVEQAKKEMEVAKKVRNEIARLHP